MCTCTALFPVADLLKMERSESLPQTFLSVRKYFGINLKVNIWHTFLPCMKTVPSLFPLPVKNSATLITGRNGKITSMKKTGVLTSRKPLMALAMPLNILDAILTRLPSQTAGSLTLRKVWSLFPQGGKSLMSQSVTSHWNIHSSSAVT